MFENFHNLRFDSETFTQVLGKSTLKIRTAQTNHQELIKRRMIFDRKSSAFSRLIEKKCFDF